MANIIKVPQLAWYDPKDLELPLPDSWEVDICNMAGYDRPALSVDQIRDAVRNPIGTPPIREMSKGKNDVVIIFDDITRVTRIAKIVPAVLEELAAAGIPDEKVRFMCALGSHAPMNRNDFVKKLGAETLARFPIYNHNIYQNCTYVGTTTRGTSVSINTEVMKCDLKIAIGSITPQIFTVFSGGGKIILPGVSSGDTISANHGMPCEPDIKADYETNPHRLDMEEAARLAGLDFNIECIFNLWGETVAVYAGDLVAAHNEGVQEAKTHYISHRADDSDIIIANTYAKVSEYANGALTTFKCSNNGKPMDIVVIGNAPEGQVVHFLAGPWGRYIWGKRRLQFKIPEHVNHLIIFSEYPDIAGLGYFEASDKIIHLNRWDDVLEKLQAFHKNDAKVSVYPNADIQYFGQN